MNYNNITKLADTGFTPIDNRVLENLDLFTGAEFKVYSIIVRSVVNTKKGFALAMKSIADKGGLHVDTVKEAVKNLIKKHWISSTPRRFKSSIYNLTCVKTALRLNGVSVGGVKDPHVQGGEISLPQGGEIPPHTITPLQKPHTRTGDLELSKKQKNIIMGKIKKVFTYQPISEYCKSKGIKTSKELYQGIIVDILVKYGYEKVSSMLSGLNTLNTGKIKDLKAIMVKRVKGDTPKDPVKSTERCTGGIVDTLKDKVLGENVKTCENGYKRLADTIKIANLKFGESMALRGACLEVCKSLGYETVISKVKSWIDERCGFSTLLARVNNLA